MEGDGTVVRQDELRMWQEPSTPGGAHSRAWSVLTNRRSRFIAQNLGIGDPSRPALCLGCHSDEATSRGESPVQYWVVCEWYHGTATGLIAHASGEGGPNHNHDYKIQRKHTITAQ